MINECAKCSQELPPRIDDYVKCGKCKALYHFTCCRMSPDLWYSKSKKHKERWKCKDCRDLEAVSSCAMTGPFAPEENQMMHSDSTSQNIFQYFFSKHMDVMNNMESALHSILHEIKYFRDDVVNRRVKLFDDGPVVRTSTSIDIRRLGQLVSPQDQEDDEKHEKGKSSVNKTGEVKQEMISNPKKSVSKVTEVNSEIDSKLTKPVESDPAVHKKVSYASAVNLMKTGIINDEKSTTNEEQPVIKKEGSRRASVI